MGKHTNNSSDIMVNNLNNNVKLDHIDFVEHGIRPADQEYHMFKKEMIKIMGSNKYKRYMQNKEQHAMNGYKEKRIIDIL